MAEGGATGDVGEEEEEGGARGGEVGPHLQEDKGEGGVGEGEGGLASWDGEGGGWGI